MTSKLILDGKRLIHDQPFISRGYKYPANWLRLANEDEKKAIGIQEVKD